VPRCGIYVDASADAIYRLEGLEIKESLWGTSRDTNLTTGGRRNESMRP
jgi:hypothetical protein